MFPWSQESSARRKLMKKNKSCLNLIKWKVKNVPLYNFNEKRKRKKKGQIFSLITINNMWSYICFFVGIILLLIGIWLFSAAMTTLDPVSASQKKTWSFVTIIVGFFLLFLAAACHDSMKGVKYY